MQNLSEISRDLRNKLDSKLEQIAEKYSSSYPYFDTEKLDRNQMDYIFYYPVLYRQGASENYLHCVVIAELLGLLVSTLAESTIHYQKWLQDLLNQFNDPTLIKQGLNAILSNSFYSKEHVCRVFKKHFGITMTEHLNRQRLELATNLLSYSDKSVLSISMELGFSSVSYFNKIFKQRYNLSPLEFRKKHIVK